jgi:general secretion pathway protein D
MSGGAIAGGETDPFVGGGAPDVGTAQMTIQGPPQVKVGDTVTVALLMQSDLPVASVTSTLSYDSTKLQFAGVTEGDFLKQGGAPTSFSSRVGAGGQLILVDSTAGGGGASTAGTFAVLTFRALAPASQTAIQLQPGNVTGAGGVPVTMAPSSPYDFSVIAR